MGAEVHASVPHVVAIHGLFPRRLAALVENDLFVPKSGLGASKDKPPLGKGAEGFHTARSP